jgi:uncharacterized protein (UPF0371 family)
MQTDYSVILAAHAMLRYGCKTHAIAFMQSGRIVHGLMSEPLGYNAIMIGNQFVNENSIESIACLTEEEYINALPEIGKMLK